MWFVFNSNYNDWVINNKLCIISFSHAFTMGCINLNLWLSDQQYESQKQLSVFHINNCYELLTTKNLQHLYFIYTFLQIQSKVAFGLLLIVYRLNIFSVSDILVSDEWVELITCCAPNSLKKCMQKS